VAWIFASVVIFANIANLKSILGKKSQQMQKVQKVC
jgi:hypothetical protein